jgi:NAD+ kinase
MNTPNIPAFDSVFIVEKVNGQDVDRVAAVVTEVRKQLVEVNCWVDPSAIVLELGDANEIDENTLIIAIGGDGTMLYAGGLAAQSKATVMGINTGRVGFLTDFSLEDIINHGYIINIMLPDQTKVFAREDRVMLTVTPETGPSFNTMNEISIANSFSDCAIEYNVRVNGMSAGSHRANSVVVSTPTGSTAYALSAGGAIIYPSLNVLEITPVAPLTMASRPIIVSGDSVIKIDARIRDGGSISARGDGRLFITRETKSSDESVSFIISVNSNKVRLLHAPNWNFFEVLTNKLGWNR